MAHIVHGSMMFLTPPRTNLRFRYAVKPYTANSTAAVSFCMTYHWDPQFSAENFAKFRGRTSLQNSMIYRCKIV